ncbi:MAG: TolC family protein [Gammaproteobacteria bacterium]|nr:TolC family protein [Gammaproteobacteria bacterium]
MPVRQARSARPAPAAQTPGQRLPRPPHARDLSGRWNPPDRLQTADQRPHQARGAARRDLEHEAAALRAQDEAVENARQALHLLQANYQAGLATYLDVLGADAQYHQAMINDLQMEALRYQDTVALYVALGGGWWSQSAAAR